MSTLINSSASLPVSPTLASATASPSARAAAAPISAVDALESDPVVAWLRNNHGSWVRDSRCARAVAITTQLLRALARGIVAALHEEGPAALARGRDLFLSTVVRPGTTLGTLRAKQEYRRAVREFREARVAGHHRMCGRLAGSYHDLLRLGVSAGACLLAARTGESFADRVHEMQRSLSLIGEEQLPSVEDAAGRTLLCPLTNEWWFRQLNGKWEGPMSDAGFRSLLAQKGFVSKGAQATIKARARHFFRREPVFDSMDDLVRRRGTSVFNAYVPTEVEPVPGTWADIYEAVVSACGRDERFINYFLDWVAAQLQSLHLRGVPLRTEIAIVLHGVEGSGKGTVWKVLEALFGSANCVVLGQTDLESKFTSQIRGKLLVNANEVISSSNRSDETANQLKPWITDAVIRLEEKNKPAENVSNFANLFFTANGDQPVLIAITDRRYAVKKALLPLDPAVGMRVDADVNGPRHQVAAFLHHLLRRPTGFHVGLLFDTSDRAKVQALSASSDAKFFHEVEQDGLAAVAAAWQAAARLNENRVIDFDGDVASQTLIEIYADYCKRNSLKACASQRFLEGVERGIPGARKLPHPRMLGGIKRRGFSGIPLVPKQDRAGFAAKVLPLPPRSPEASTESPTLSAEAS